MGKITLTQKTIDAILAYKEYLLGNGYAEYQDETTKGFYQGDCSITVDFGLSMEWIEDKEVHSEVPPPNIEDLSHYECVKATIENVYTFDKDGNYIEFDKELFK